MKDTKIMAYKGFDKDLKCRGYQYEIGKTFTHEGEVVKCDSGFHSCEYPLDVLCYYNPVDSRFCVVEAFGEIDMDDDDDTKIASRNISIIRELSIQDLVSASVDWITSKLDKSKYSIKYTNQSHAINTGYKSISSSTGYKSVSSNTGDNSISSSTGDESVSSSTGYKSISNNTGYKSISSSAGSYSVSNNTGYKSISSNTGDNSISSSTGSYSVSNNTGSYSVSSSTGYKSVSSVNGSNSIALASGYNSKAKASKGSAIVLVYRDSDGNLIHIKAAISGKEIKSDTWYILDEDGNFQETE